MNRPDDVDPRAAALAHVRAACLTVYRLVGPKRLVALLDAR